MAIFGRGKVLKGHAALTVPRGKILGFERFGAAADGRTGILARCECRAAAASRAARRFSTPSPITGNASTSEIELTIRAIASSAGSPE